MTDDNHWVVRAGWHYRGDMNMGYPLAARLHIDNGTGRLCLTDTESDKHPSRQLPPQRGRVRTPIALDKYQIY